MLFSIGTTLPMLPDKVEYIIPYFTFHDNNDSVLNNVETGQDLTTDLCKKTVYNKLKQMSSV